MAEIIRGCKDEGQVCWAVMLWYNNVQTCMCIEMFMFASLLSNS
jgi:hypothetical protein